MAVYQPVKTRFKPFLSNDVPSQCFEFVDRENTPTIIQVGANDGIVGEDYGFSEFLSELDSFNLYLIEPIEKYYDNLPSIYDRFSSDKKKIHYCNFAITSESGSADMIDLGGCSRIIPQGTGGISVKSKTWNSFVEEYEINKIDLLLMDCEGYEFSILSGIDYTMLKPNCIRYEFYHIPDKLKTDQFLMSNGYYVSFCETDPTYNKVAVNFKVKV